jgi:DNA-binding SARP family transcriptional activator
VGVEFLVLGPLEARDGDAGVQLGGAKQRAVLAMLLVRRNQVVSRERLIHGVWGDTPPASAGHTLEAYISRLRKALRDAADTDRLLLRPPGYMLRVWEGEFDLDRFEALVDQGRCALSSDAAAAAAVFHEALALFRGAPLEDLAYAPFAQEEIPRLEDLRLAVIEQRIDADLAIGSGAELVGELETLVRAHPLRERFWGQLMLASYRSGRQGDALAAFDRARRILSEQLGVTPGKPLQLLQRRVLDHDPALELVAWTAVVSTDDRLPDAGTSPVRPPIAPATVSAQPTAESGSRIPSPPDRKRRVWSRRIVGVSASCAVTIAVIVGLTVVLGQGSAARFLRVRPNSVAVIDPTAQRVVADVRLGSAPGAIVAGFHRIWVGEPGNQKLAWIDPVSVRSHDFGVPLPPMNIAVGDGSVFVYDGGSGRGAAVDPARLQSTPFGVPNHLCDAGLSAGGSCDGGGLAVGGGQVWVGTTTSQRVWSLNQARLNLEGSPTPHVFADTLTWGLGSLWAYGDYGDYVYQIDPRRHAVVRTYSTSRQSIFTTAPQIVTGDDQVWVASPLGYVTVLDPNGRPPQTITLRPGLTSATVTGNWLWVTSNDGRLYQISLYTRQIHHTYQLHHQAEGVTVAYHRVWVTLDK